MQCISQKHDYLPVAEAYTFPHFWLVLHQNLTFSGRNRNFPPFWWDLLQKLTFKIDFLIRNRRFSHFLFIIVWRFDLGCFLCNMKGTWWGQDSICQPVSLKSNIYYHLLTGWQINPWHREAGFLVLYSFGNCQSHFTWKSKDKSESWMNPDPSGLDATVCTVELGNSKLVNSKQPGNSKLFLFP